MGGPSTAAAFDLAAAANSVLVLVGEDALSSTVSTIFEPLRTPELLTDAMPAFTPSVSWAP